MSFVIGKPGTVSTTVQVYETDENDKLVEQKLRVRFRKLLVPEFRALTARVQDDASAETWLDVLLDNVVGIDDVVDTEGNPVEVTRDVIEQIISRPEVFSAVLEKFISLQTAERENERRKNLSKPAKAGR